MARKPTIVREPARAPGSEISVTRMSTAVTSHAGDVVAVEEPLEIWLNGWRWMVTMRTPGDDADLVTGLLASEGVISAAGEIERIVFTRHPEEPDLANVVDVGLDRAIDELRGRLTRHQTTSSSCGLCGASTIEAIAAERPPLPPGPSITPATLAALPDRLAAAQPVFRATGGLHAAALFDTAGTLLSAREDIGRHNATDKVLGWRLRNPAEACDAAVLLVSGRASFEIVQKAVVAHIPIVAAVSAPSSMAVGLAARAGMTLAGFVRGGELNVYTGEERLTAASTHRVPTVETTAGAPPSDGTVAPAASRDRATASGGDDSLEFIPRGVRTILDQVALKISLVDWQALTLAERGRLIALAADARPDEFARYLDARVTARTGKPPRPLAKRAEPRP